MTATGTMLAALPTPLTRAAGLERALGCPPLYVKRDDLTGFAFGGTKARAVDALIGDATASGCDVLVVGGGPTSNLVALAAVAARRAGLDVVAVLYGTRPGPRSVNAALLAEVTADVRWTGTPERDSVDTALPEVADTLAGEGRHPYVVPRGGATGVGTAGTARAVAELDDQLTAAGVAPAVIVVATGSAGLQAALVAGTEAGGHPWRIVGVSVSRPLAECRQRVHRLAHDCAEVLGWPAPAPDRVEVRDGRGPGFGVPSPEGTRAARLALETEGLLFDPVYTAKAAAAVPEVAGDGDGPVVLWHSGGTPAVCDRLAHRPATDGEEAP